ncbi:MAG: hypothetical protein WD894_06845 [Pirellulales bacterium]
MTDLFNSRKRRSSLRLVSRFRGAMAAFFIVAQLFPPGVVLATDLPGVLPAALDQPRINAVLRRTPTGDPLTADFGGVRGFNIDAFFDTGASGVLLSKETAEALGVQKLKHPDPQSGQLVDVEFEDVGVAGSEFFGVSEELYVSLSPYFEPGQEPTLPSYNQTFGPIRTQISLEDANPLIGPLDIFGMPTMTGKVIVMDPKPTDIFSNPIPGFMRTYVYNPGTPFNPATPQTNPGIPAVDRHIDLSYGAFERFTQTTPAGAPGPTLRNNPFIGPNPVLQLDPNPPADNTPGVSITFGDQSSTGSWLLDTGAAASIISLEQAANLHVRYRPGTEGTDNPRLETFDPMDPSQPGTIIPDQFAFDIGGIGGTIKRSGFYLDSLLLRTQEGDVTNPDDPDHIRYLGAPVLVFDITLQDPMTQQSLTLDGIFGMNMLVATASISFGPGGLPIFDGLQDGYFNWVVFDEPDGTLGLDLKSFVAPPPNEWLRTTGGNWGSAANWSQGFVPDGDTQSALLGMSLPSNGVVNLQATDRTLRLLRFSNDDASYTLASEGGTLVFDSSSGPAAIEFDFANQRSHEISAPIRIASDLEINTTDPVFPLTLSGGQTWEANRKMAVRTGTLRYNLDAADLLIVDGGNTLTIDEGATVELAGSRTPLTGAHSVLDVVTHIDVVNNSAGGLLVAAGNHEAGSITGQGSTSVAGGSLIAQAVRQSALSIAAGHKVTTRLNGTSSGVSVLGSLSLAGTPSAPTATFDLTNNSAVIDYSGTSPVATVRQQIISGRGGPGMNATWTGPGITSSAAAAANTTAPESRSVGYAENSALPLGPYMNFRGQSVDDTSILMAYTRTGDANLDGVVNDDDVTIVGATYAPGVAQPHWALGDFDYNGFVDDDDVTLLGVFYDPTAAPLITPAPAAEFAVTAVPEPASIAFLATMAAVLLVLHRSRARRPRRSLGTAGRPV